MIIRVNKTDNYTTMCNHHLRDINLSLKAVGLLSKILSLPDDWDYSIKGLVSICKENETSIKTTLNELKSYNYLSINKIRNEKGQYEYVYDIYEKPNIDFPGVENPPLDEPEVENQVQLNTNKQNTEELNTEEYKKNIIKDNFERFWKAYPRKQKKSKAEAWFMTHNPSDELMEQIMSSLEKFKKTDEWKKANGQYIPHPTSWLNGRRWEDELTLEEIKMSDEEINAEIEKQLKEEGFYDNR